MCLCVLHACLCVCMHEHVCVFVCAHLCVQYKPVDVILVLQALVVSIYTFCLLEYTLGNDE